MLLWQSSIRVKEGSYLFELPVVGFGHLSVHLKLIEFMNLAL
jgi:hypothetical protein